MAVLAATVTVTALAAEPPGPKTLIVYVYVPAPSVTDWLPLVADELKFCPLTTTVAAVVVAQAIVVVSGAMPEVGDAEMMAVGAGEFTTMVAVAVFDCA